MKTSLIIGLAAIMMSSPGIIAFGQSAPQPKNNTSATAMKSVSNDATFLADIDAWSIFEIELGKAALKKAISTQVQEFAKMMVDDHTNVKTDLKALATSKKVMLANGIQERYQKVITALTAKSGQDFDREYLAIVHTEYGKEVELIKNASENAKDADIKTFSKKTLPRLLYHLEMVERLEKATAN
ncbi:DUF4142 domain-containing protein [Runella sp.]|uniref:DUF4142 domain-containing protein n=1 Tax=Runella sp. TaxID=1960881 RepID=UPI003D1313E0